jgi:hypothetical protein
MTETAVLTRRTLLAASFASASLGAAHAQSVKPNGRLVFAVWRNNSNIGRHSLAFSGGDQDFVVAIDAVMAVSLGRVPLFKYHHQATETWRGGQFAELQSHTISNGKQEHISAVRGPDGVTIRTDAGVHAMPASAMPLTHWNPHALQGPLFNPQSGAVVHESVSRQSGQTARMGDGRLVPATRYTLSGDAQIVDWYDIGGVWIALRGKAPDGSFLDYRRSA